MAEISKQALIVENNTSFPNNNNGAITPSDLRSFNIDMIDSLVDEISYNQFSASVTNSISLLNVFSSSQQPSFTALNAFTASQLVLNTGYNNATSSLSTQIGVVSAEVDQLQTWSGSVNQILFNGIAAGYSTRFNFGGFLSASLVQNVNGTIADINYLQDPTKLNTGSFNTYTASVSASQSIFSASVANTLNTSNTSFNAYTASTNAFTASAQASINELLALSSSLSGGYATQGELDASASALQSNIDTKVFTSSFNDYTQSTNNTIATLTLTSSFNSYTASTNSRLNSIEATTASLNTRYTNLELRTASYATTGSNNLFGAQNISGSLTLTGSVYANVISASIVSSTASLDFSTANFFRLTLPASSSTFINIQNPSAGQTALLEVNTLGSESFARFSTNIFQPDASYYLPTQTAGSDILTFTSFTSTKTYLASVKTMTNNY